MGREMLPQLYILQSYSSRLMNYTLKELQQRVNNLIEQQGEDAYCAAWIYTQNDCYLKDENGDIEEDKVLEDSFLVRTIMRDVGDNDYIYQVIQESIDEATEENYMQYQQELV